MELLTDEQKAERVRKIALWGIGAAALVVVSPLVYALAYALLGVAAAGVALAIAGTVGLLLVNFAPVLARKIANAKLEALKAEARKNPIVTRQNIAIAEAAKLRARAEELTIFGAEVNSFADEVKTLSREQPEDAADFQEQLRRYRQLYERKAQALKNAVDKLEEFKRATERAARKWKVAQSALRMSKLAGASQEDEINKIMAAESLDSVQNAMHRAFAELDTIMAVSTQDVKRIEHTPSGEIIDAVLVPPSKVEVPR